MPLKNDIVDRERLDEIPVTILEIEKVFNSSLAWRLTVEDDAGNEFEVKIWHTHEVDLRCREGWRYVLKNGRGKHQRNDEVLLSSTDDFTVCRPDGTVELLAMGDTHIGRENRPRDAGAPYRTARQFVAAMGYAARYDVEAVIHAGDLFDDNPTPEDISIAESAFDILSRHDIPFYFIYGNHGVDIAKDFYDQLRNVTISHLDTGGVCLDGRFELFGVDNKTEENFTTAASDFATTSEINRRILVVHNEINPPRKESEILVETLCSPPEVQFDYILSGHLHDPESDAQSGTEIQYLGSTADISANRNARDQSAWLIRVGPDNVDIRRLELQ